MVSLLHKTQAGFLLGLSRSQSPKNRVLMQRFPCIRQIKTAESNRPNSIQAFARDGTHFLRYQYTLVLLDMLISKLEKPSKVDFEKVVEKRVTIWFSLQYLGVIAVFKGELKDQNLCRIMWCINACWLGALVPIRHAQFDSWSRTSVT